MGNLCSGCAEPKCRVYNKKREPHEEIREKIREEIHEEIPKEPSLAAIPQTQSLRAAPSFFNPERKPTIGHYRVIETLVTHDNVLVSKVVDLTTNIFYAAKVYQFAELNRSTYGNATTLAESVETEIVIMNQIRHPNCLPLVDLVTDEVTDTLSLIMPLAPHTLMPGNTLCQLEEDKAQGVFADVALGLQYLHACNVIHRDVKPDNVFLFGDRAVLADYSVSTIVDPDDDTCEETRGPIMFIAPEACSGQKFHGKPADVWALGLTLYIIIYGQRPFPEGPLVTVMNMIMNKEIVYPETVEISDDLRDLFSHLLDRNPETRYTMDQVVQHPWVRPYIRWYDEEEDPWGFPEFDADGE